MLKIINSLSPFFEDNYKRINVREYARIKSQSPPSTSKHLDQFRKELLLKKEQNGQFIYYFANKESSLFVDLSRIYWKSELEKAGFFKLLEEYVNPLAILFGSLSKSEVKPDSDVDIAIFSATNKAIQLESVEKRLKRKIQLFAFKSPEDVANKELLKNIMNGYVLVGGW